MESIVGPFVGASERVGVPPLACGDQRRQARREYRQEECFFCKHHGRTVELHGI